MASACDVEPRWDPRRFPPASLAPRPVQTVRAVLTDQERFAGGDAAGLLEVVLREVLARAVPEAAGPSERVRLHAVRLIPADGGRVLLRPRVRAAAPRGGPAVSLRM